MKNIKKVLCIALAILTLCSFMIMPSYAASSDNIVARMYVFSAVTNKAAGGHSWIYIENLSDQAIVVGLYTVPVDGTVSVSTGKNRRADGAGVYYNVDSYLVNNKGCGVGRRSLQMDITAAQLERVSNTINSNNRWSVAFNCSNFAEKVWNSAGGKKVYSLGTPSFLKTYINLQGGRKNAAMQNAAPEQCFKQKGSQLVICSSASLTKPF